MAQFPLQTLKNNITDRFHENHEQDITGEDMQEMFHDTIDSLAAYDEENIASDKNYLHDQGVPSAVWYIHHDLNKFPAVTVFDSAGTEVIGHINHVDENNVTITFTAAFSGKATCN